MYRARAFAVAAVIVVYGAVGARQPAVRVAVPLPVSAAVIVAAASLPDTDAATLLLNLTRVLYDVGRGQDPAGNMRRAALREALASTPEKPGGLVPLPLDPSIWRDTILEQPVPDDRLIATILADRRAALLYYGLAALDDETLAWLGPDRETLQHLRNHPGMFAAFGRSLRITGTRIAVPGGDPADALWGALVGVEPQKAAAFVQRLFRGNGRMAFLYDTIAHLDEARQRFALGMHLPEAARADRLVALFDGVAHGAEPWDVADNPFVRPTLDAAVMLSALHVTPDGELAGPRDRRLWERVFNGDDRPDAPFVEAAPAAKSRGEAAAIDAAWLAARIARVPNTLGRRRLDVVLFAQRVFAGEREADPALASALRGVEAFPALALTLERLGISEPDAYVSAAQSAEILTRMRREPQRRTAVLSFQAALGIIERAHRSGGLEPDAARRLARGLLDLHVPGERGFAARLSSWLHADFIGAFARGARPDVSDPIEVALLEAVAGVRPSRPARPTIEWEGHRYIVDPAGAEAGRLAQVRARQGAPSLDAAMEAVSSQADGGDRDPIDPGAARALADTLASILYAAHLGDPDSQAVRSGNVALRHDFGFPTPPRSARSSTAWRLPVEEFGSTGWHVRGSLLGLETALGRLSFRRLDPTLMPEPPGLGPNDMQALMLTAALLSPAATTDIARDEIAAAIGRGRARAMAMTPDPADVRRIAIEGGLSEWRRQALAWTVVHDPSRTLGQFSLVELFWLGAPRPAGLQTIDAWGTAGLPLSGCLCLEMPRARATEDFGGRPSAGLLATRYADAALRVASALASLDLPAALAPGVLGFAVQDIIEQTRPAYPGDAAAFGRAAAALTEDRIVDYVAALTANGPLVPTGRTASNQQ